MSYFSTENMLVNKYMTDSWLPEQGSMTFFSLNFEVLEWPIKIKGLENNVCVVYQAGLEMLTLWTM